MRECAPNPGLPSLWDISGEDEDEMSFFAPKQPHFQPIVKPDDDDAAVFKIPAVPTSRAPAFEDGHGGQVRMGKRSRPALPVWN